MSAATTASRRSGTGGWLASPPPTAAVEIAADRVTALVVADQGNGVAVSAYAAEPLKPGVVEPALNAANVHDAATLAATVGGVFDRIGTRPRRIALVIPDTAVKVSLGLLGQAVSDVSERSNAGKVARRMSPGLSRLPCHDVTR